MDRLKLEICCGTTCFLLGADKLLRIENLFPDAWREHVEVRAIPCFNECIAEKLCGAPFARLDGELISHATVEKIFSAIDAKFKAEK